MHVPEPSAGQLRFEGWNIGEYYALADEADQIDTTFREYALTARQAAQRFGEDVIPEDLQVQIAEGKGDQADSKHHFLQVTMPREDRRPQYLDAVNMPIASYHIHLPTKTLMRESGFWEQPTVVHRHLLWEDSVWGWAPAFVALPECRQLNEIQMNLDTLVELLVDPRTLVPANLSEEIDLRAGGATFFTDPNMVPREWATVSDYPSGKDRANDKQHMIRQAFHVDLFQALAAVPPGTEMTATEVLARQRDRLTMFSPTFSRKVTELHTPILQRIFAVMLRGGAFPEPPQELVLFDNNGAFIPDPSIQFTSRLALALEALHTEGFDRTMARVLPIVQAFPDVLDNFDVDTAIRSIARAEGMNEEHIRPDRDVQRLREQKQAEIDEANLREDMIEEAETAGKLGLAGPQGQPNQAIA